MAKAVNEQITCPCGSKKSYPQCCEVLHNGVPAITAEALMRSRYTAFVRDMHEYIQRSWHTSTRPALTELSDQNQTHWVGLQIKRHEQLDDCHATVEFIARYKINGRAFLLHEVSRFVREGEHWFYIDGDILHP